MENKKEIYVSQEELLRKRKWTRKLIEDFLPSSSISLSSFSYSRNRKKRRFSEKVFSNRKKKGKR